jgi:hypothetical protein
VACLFCGKDIGPIRLLRDSEFCSPKHRKQYKDRLQQVLVRVGEPETVTCGVAPFQDSLRPVAGQPAKFEAAFDFSSAGHDVQLPQAWSLEIPAVEGGVFSRFELSACDLTAHQPTLSYRSDAFPYFDNSAGRLGLPEPQLGAVLLRSLEGELVSPPIALDYRAGTESPAARSANPTPLAKAYAPALPGFVMAAAECEEMKQEAEPAPAETWMSTAAEPAVPAGQPSLSEPISARADLHVPTALPEPANQPARILDDFVTPPQPSESWMRRPPAEPVAPAMRPVAAETAPILSGLRLPDAIFTPLTAPRPEVHAAHFAGAEPQAAPMEARLSTPAVLPFPVALASPGLQQVEIPRAALLEGNAPWMQTPQSEPAAREVRPSACETPMAFAAAPIRVAPLMIRPVDDLLEMLVEQTPAASSPMRKMRLDARAAAPQAPAQSRASAPAAPVTRQAGKSAASSPAVMPAAAGQPQTEVPQAGLVAIDYHCPAGPMVPQANLRWAPTASTLKLNLPRFAVRPVFDRLEDQTPVKAPRKGPAFAEIFTMPDAAAVTQRKAARHAFTAIAASVTVAMALWFGANAGKFGKDLINREAAEEMAAAARIHTQGGSVETATAQSRPALPEPSALSHPVAWVRTAAAKRATVQVADSFENGMAAWGAKEKSWASGWSRSADGYVRPGQLALFQPTVHYTDYRMEFFGQIEDRSMSWVVRGKDTKNYYAMKFNIVSPGLRPILSMTHYPVVGGKQGHKVETPLSVMVQNNMPYHVSVEVKGSHYTASIEGQEVDSWSDDTLLAGGVGFFSEAGARARIYWMKVAKNDDWLGRLCSHIAGDEGPRDTAWLDRPALPVPQPERPAPVPATAALWPAETAEGGYGKLQRDRSSWKGEIETWS